MGARELLLSFTRSQEATREPYRQAREQHDSQGATIGSLYAARELQGSYGTCSRVLDASAECPTPQLHSWGRTTKEKIPMSPHGRN